MRVVFDTNIFISAFLVPGRQADKALDRIVSGLDRLVISKAIIDEALTVLEHKFGWSSERLGQAATLLVKLGEIIATKQRLQLLRDDPDNRILECAVAGRADLIVTGDREMLDLKQFEGIRIVSLRSYLDLK
ncbi:MAG TPA: putative toxin-antitoxin system toxin component, PIN family [Candidatus Binataceae bacterium]|nr:putative toxin-antitoxin system toxin component, PIN family [Candidatus Binataceae bacterium]